MPPSLHPHHHQCRRDHQHSSWKKTLVTFAYNSCILEWWLAVICYFWVKSRNMGNMNHRAVKLLMAKSNSEQKWREKREPGSGPLVPCLYYVDLNAGGSMSVYNCLLQVRV